MVINILLVMVLLYIYSLGDNMINRYATTMLLLASTVMAPVMFAQQTHAKSIAGHDAGAAASRSGTTFDVQAPTGHGTSWIVGYYAQQAVK
jgi:hypothetical protein